jgi:hypothetical protein
MSNKLTDLTPEDIALELKMSVNPIYREVTALLHIRPHNVKFHVEATLNQSLEEKVYHVQVYQDEISNPSKLTMQLQIEEIEQEYTINPNKLITAILRALERYLESDPTK